MSADFWKSTHCERWTSVLTAEELKKANADDQAVFTPRELKILTSHMLSSIRLLGQRLGFRQIVIATAIIFARRFYLATSFASFDPRLIVLAVTFLASKVEECQVSLDSLFKAQRAISTDPNDRALVFSDSHILECEWYIVSYLRFDLIVYHPYRPLTQYIADVNLQRECLQSAWSIVNDSYESDAIFLYPPYVVALAAIFMACIYAEKDPTRWFEGLNVDQQEVQDVVQQLLTLYREHSPPSKSELAAAIAKLDRHVPPAAAPGTSSATAPGTRTSGN